MREHPIHPDPRDLDALLPALLDGSLDAPARATLTQLVRTNPDARRVYLDYLTTHVALQWHHGQTPALTLPATHPTTPPLALNPHPSPPRPWRTPTLRPPKRLVLPLAATLLLAAAALAIYAVSLAQQSKIDDRKPRPILAFVADVSAGTLMVDEQIAAAGEAYTGRLVSLDSGEAEFMLPNQVAVRMRGKTHLTIHDAMNVSMASGSAEFDCPPRAKGYTVHLPRGSRIVDLGTAFRVDLDADGRCRLVVLDGSVAVHGPNLPRRTLTQASGLTITPDGLAADDLPPGYAAWLVDRHRRSADPALAFDLDAAPHDAAVGDPVRISRPDAAAHGVRWADGRWLPSLAMDFDGRDSHVAIDLPGESAQLTVAAWINVRSLRHTVNDILAADGTGGVHLHLMHDGRFTAAAVGNNQLRTPPFIDADRLNRWVHLAFVVDHDAGLIRVYRDGELFHEAHVTEPAPRPLLVGPARIGGWHPLAYTGADRQRTFDGRIDDLFILRRPATPDEIRRWHHSAAPAKPATDRITSDQSPSGEQP